MSVEANKQVVREFFSAMSNGNLEGMGEAMKEAMKEGFESVQEPVTNDANISGRP